MQQPQSMLWLVIDTQNAVDAKIVKRNLNEDL